MHSHTAAPGASFRQADFSAAQHIARSAPFGRTKTSASSGPSTICSTTPSKQFSPSPCLRNAHVSPLPKSFQAHVAVRKPLRSMTEYIPSQRQPPALRRHFSPCQLDELHGLSLPQQYSSTSGPRYHPFLVDYIAVSHTITYVPFF